jgi:hypothetical protein
MVARIGLRFGDSAPEVRGLLDAAEGELARQRRAIAPALLAELDAKFVQTRLEVSGVDAPRTEDRPPRREPSPGPE